MQGIEGATSYIVVGNAHPTNRPPGGKKSLLKSKSFGKPAPTHNGLNLIPAAPNYFL